MVCVADSGENKAYQPTGRYLTARRSHTCNFSRQLLQIRSVTTFLFVLVSAKNQIYTLLLTDSNDIPLVNT